MAQSTKQVRVVSQATPTPNQGMEPTAFFDADGEPIDLAAEMAIAESASGGQ